MSLSDREIKELVEEANSCKFNKFGKALDCYDRIIENAPAHPFYFRERARIFLAIGKDFWRLAIRDINRTIEMDPDNAEYYEARGECYLKRLSEDSVFHPQVYRDPSDGQYVLRFCNRVFIYHDELKPSIKSHWLRRRRLILGKAAGDFKVSIEKDPAKAGVWLYLLELNIFLCNFDEAISMYGSCRPYIKIKEDSLIRAWLGCLALVFAGDVPAEEDKKPLYDLTVKAAEYSRISRVSAFIMELRNQDNYKEKCQNAIGVQKLIINHLEGWRKKGDKFRELECYEEALAAYDKALKIEPEYFCHNTEKLIKVKIDVLRQLKRDKEALFLEKMIKPRSLFAQIISNTRLKKARIFAMKGEKKSTLKYLSKAIKLDFVLRYRFIGDNAFKNFRDDPEFKALTE